MLRLEAKFISKERILEEIGGHSNFGLGDPAFINKPINIFVDHVPTEYELSLNPYNFLFILEPNEYFFTPSKNSTKSILVLDSKIM